MRKIIYATFIFLFSSNIGFGQINIGFETETGLNYSMHKGIDSIWQIAKPTKGRFTSAHSGDFALVTDSVNLVQATESAILEFCFNKGRCFNLQLSFYHKYFTDSLHSGGMLEVSYDSGYTWINVIYDTLQMDTYFYNFYSASDTITGGYPAFTGSNDEWKYSMVSLTRHSICGQSYSINYRLVYKTDSLAMPLEGWMIDDVSMNILECGKIDANSQSGNSCFSIINEGNKTYSVIPEEDCLIKICSLSGSTVFNKNTKSKEKMIIDCQNWQPGYYIVTSINKNYSCSRKIHVYK